MFMMCPLCNSNSRDEITYTRLRAHVLQCRLGKATKHLATKVIQMRELGRQLRISEEWCDKYRRGEQALKQELEVARRERMEAMGRSLERGREIEELKTQLKNAEFRIDNWKASYEHVRGMMREAENRRRRKRAKELRANRGRK